MTVTAADILRTAADLVSGDRNETHGDADMCHENIALLWSAYLDIHRGRTTLDGHDVALMMTLLKLARTAGGKHNPDDYVDGAAYMALAGMMAGGR